MSARSLLRRWNVRTLRHEWRQHVVIFVVMSLAVMLSVTGVLAAFNMASPPERDLGGGRFAVSTGADPALLEDALTAGGHRFGSIASGTATISPGRQRVALRALDPANAVTEPLIALRRGRWPETSGEIAVTDRVGANLAVGRSVDLGDAPVTVVGIVENPLRLDDEFVLVTELDRFTQDASAQFLVDAEPAAVDLGDVPNVSIAVIDGGATRTALTLVATVVSGFGLMQVGLLVGAGFAVIASRRRRQIGLLAAAGADPGHIRTSCTGVGVLLGSLAAAVGTIAGFGVAWTLLPRMETQLGYRIAFAVPWGPVVAIVAMAVGVAGLAARWPARTFGRENVSTLLAAERPRPARVGRSTAAGVVVASGGAAALAFGFAQVNVTLALVGVLLAPVGLLLLSPLVVHAVARVAARGRIGRRMAGRLIVRHGARSSALVGSLALALAVPAGLIVVTSSIDARRAAQGPNLDDRWFLVWEQGADDATHRIPAALDGTGVLDVVDRLASAFPDMRFIPIEGAVDRDGPQEPWDFDGLGLRPSLEPVFTGRPGSSECISCDTVAFDDRNAEAVVWIIEGETWIATPELVEVLGVDPPSGAIAVAAAADLGPVSPRGELDGHVAVSETWPVNARLPQLLLSEDAVDRAGLERVVLGLLGVAEEPLTIDERARVEEVMGPNLVAEFHATPPSSDGLRAAALGIGGVFGVGLALAATFLLVIELERDRRTLAVLGADPGVARRLVASVGAMVGTAGALTAVAIGYVALVPLLAAEGEDFPFVVPWSELLVLLLAFPAVAAVGAVAALGTPRHATSRRLTGIAS